MKHTAPLLLVLACSTRLSAQDIAPPTRAAPEPSRLVGSPVLVIDESLATRAGTLHSIDERAVVISDGSGRRLVESIAAIAAVLVTRAPVSGADGVGAPSPEAARDAAAVERILRRLRTGPIGVLETVDGQRFPGHFSTTAGQEDAIVWTHPAFGTVIFPFEEVAAAFRDMDEARLMPEAATAPLDDVLVLTNGDRLRGFVVGLGDPVEIEVDDQPVLIPAERVSAAILSNPRRARSGDMVWLEDGTAALIDRFALTERGMITVALPNGSSGDYESSALRALAFGVERFVALSSLTPVEQAPVGDRRIAEPIITAPNSDDMLASSAPALGAFDVILPGPMRVVYNLPPGASRLAMTALLGADAGAWGDCELVVSIDGREAARAHLSAEHPTHAINVEASGRSLTITLEPGRFGPIRDSAVLARPIILVDRPAGAAE